MAGATVSFTVGGCSGRGRDGSDPDFDPSYRLGGAPPAAVEAEPVQEYEYLPEEDRVRIQYDSGETTTHPFDEWGSMRAAEHAADHVASILDDESLLGDGVSVGWGRLDLSEIDWAGERSTPTEEEFDRDADFGPSVTHLHHYDRDGDLLSEPEVSFDSVVEATPRTTEVTVLFPELEYTATFPVLCERTAIQNE
ncbi:hypothetical protein [Halomicrobium salinisoli]|uniref:hypothetical protein n=1 Tax=Halomicrobium salinisoli TaxID=2878391 RepID=UPI001CEFC0F9|nr:hypothetical protein [Halomicrobium salinisoli]